MPSMPNAQQGSFRRTDCRTHHCRQTRGSLGNGCVSHATFRSRPHRHTDSRGCVFTICSSDANVLIDSEEVKQLAELYVINGPGGVPKWILTDGGSEFKAEFNHMCDKYHIEHRTSAPGHSQSHGMVERLVATTELTLAHLIDDDMNVWDKMVSHAQMTHNSTPHPALSNTLQEGYTPVRCSWAGSSVLHYMSHCLIWKRKSMGE